jgi:hypothetical protein
VHGRKDFSGFTGDRKFAGNDYAWKWFSRLRGSHGGLYTWRIDKAGSESERQGMTKKAEFTLKQAYALCPSSPEALYRYVDILLRSGQADDA